jgi:hypothetical protein
MKKMMHATKFYVSLVLLAAATGCSGRAPDTGGTPGTAGTSGTTNVRVTEVTLGRAIGGDKAITDRTENFRPNDTIYASVATDGSAPTARLRVKWTFDDSQTVNESTSTIAPQNRERTAFHISKPDGWPAGKYKVEVFLNDQSAGLKTFDVKAP